MNSTTIHLWQLLKRKLLQDKNVPGVGFEPTKLAYEILSLTPLTNLGTLAPPQTGSHYNLQNDCQEKMLPTGVEPVTLGLLDPRSNRLSYESCSTNRLRWMFVI
jgi:hypothetical protein